MDDRERFAGTNWEEFLHADPGAGEVSMEHAQDLASVVRSVVDESLSQGVSKASRARSAWWRANGDREHAHTQGIYLKERPNRPPMLVVYIDSSVLLQDFTTNRELYLARLANIGFEVSDIQFRLGRRQKAEAGRLPKRKAAPELIPLDAETAAAIDEAAAGLPEGLRETASRALKMAVARTRQRAEEGESDER